MCGRFANRHDARELTALFQTAITLSNHRALPSYNISPGTPVPVITSNGVERKGGYMHWGLASPIKVQGGVKGKVRGRSLLINARAETMTEKPTFRDAAAARRCVVLASGWYEWKAPKQPYYITRTDAAPMAFAGLYWPGENPAVVIITTAADAGLADIHHRAPLQISGQISPQRSVDSDDHMARLDAWLDPNQPQEQIMSMISPSPAAALSWHPVAPEVGKNTIDHAGLITPYDAAAHDPQPSLF